MVSKSSYACRDMCARAVARARPEAGEPVRSPSLVWADGRIYQARIHNMLNHCSLLVDGLCLQSSLLRPCSPGGHRPVDAEGVLSVRIAVVP